MAYDYGYGELGNQMIDLFRSGAPDFEAAENLLRQGADLNAEGKYDSENILSEILLGYWQSAFDESLLEEIDYRSSLGLSLGRPMCAVIRFFLDHGFDVTKNDRCYGAQCLFALATSTFDRYIIDATKMLLDAGAKNRSISPSPTEANETPWNAIGMEGHFQGAWEGNHALADIYEAVYQIYQAMEDGRPYSGIDCYEVAVGKKILKVLAESNGDRPVFYPMALPGFQKDHCYTKTLYFVYEGGVLITTQYADFWTDTILPDGELVDVSAHFQGVVDSTIRRFVHAHREVKKGIQGYTQPIVTLEMDSGQKARFSINYGEVEEKDRAAYFELEIPISAHSKEAEGSSWLLKLKSLREAIRRITSGFGR